MSAIECVADTMLTLSADEYLDYENKIGNLVDPKYGENSFTPLKINKIAVAVFGILSAVFSYGMLSVFPPLTVVGIIAAGYCGYKLHLYFQCYDYDNPQVRADLTKQTPKLSLCEIVDKHTIEKVTGYALLGDKPRVYKSFEHLGAEYLREKSYYNQQKRLLDIELNQKLAPFRVRVEQLEGQQKMLRSQADHKQNNGQTTVYEGLSMIGNAFTLSQATSELDEAKALFSRERNEKLAPFTRGFNDACFQINEDFDRVRKVLCN